MTDFVNGNAEPRGEGPIVGRIGEVLRVHDQASTAPHTEHSTGTAGQTHGGQIACGNGESACVSLDKLNTKVVGIECKDLPRPILLCFGDRIVEVVSEIILTVHILEVVRLCRYCGG